MTEPNDTPPRHPDREALALACREAVPGARVLGLRQLHGGQSAVTHAIRVETVPGARQWLILRRWFPKEWLPHPEKRALAEHRTLSALEATNVPAPSALWLDEQGHLFGVPATIQTRLPGRPSWPEAIPRYRAFQMGEALARIHACEPPSGLPSSRLWVEPFLAPEVPPPPFRSTHPGMAVIWEALKRAGTTPLGRDSVLLHGDYHAGNTLWAHGRLCGVVDWETVELGPRGRDLGYSRMDCTITGGRQMAAALTEGYGGETADLWFWELLAAVEAAAFYREWLPAWRRYGLVDLKLPTVRRRLDGFIKRALAAAGA